MQKNLVIVESPAKAKTIEKFLGADYKVLSSYGHIRDLKKKEFSIDTTNFAPQYEIPSEKTKLVNELKAEAKNAGTVWLASDEDREGEAISWHLYEVLGLKPEQTKRIVFHEITKPAILQAIEHPRDIDLNLVNAQQARRVLCLLYTSLEESKTRAFCRTRAKRGRTPDCGTRTGNPTVQKRRKLSRSSPFHACQ